MMRLFKAFGLAIGAVIAIAVWRALSLNAPPPPPATPAPIAVAAEAAIERLQAALRIPVISNEGLPPDTASLQFFHQWLALAYPQVHRQLQRETIGGGALLFSWTGSDPTLAPAILLAHQDVVPVDAGAAERWTHPPFAAIRADGYIWGRGALDDKASLTAILEAAEALLASGYTPRRSLMFGFGHDEEVGGNDGAARIVETLADRGVRAAFVLDEGGSLTRGVVPGVSGDVALVGIAEKGYLSIELAVSGAGGHSSMPPPQSAIGILAAAVARLEARPMPSRLTAANTAMLDAIAPRQPFSSRLILANRWLFDPLIRGMLGASASGNASIRTTTAATVFHAGVKDNVLPSDARAVINFRLLPGDSVEAVVNHARTTIDDPRISVGILPGFAPKPASPISPIGGDAWAVVNNAIVASFPDAVVAPYLVIGGTDAAHYTPLTDAIYRFSPFPLKEEDLPRIHGIDERVGEADYLKAVEFMSRVMVGAGG